MRQIISSHNPLVPQLSTMADEKHHGACANGRQNGKHIDCSKVSEIIHENNGRCSSDTCHHKRNEYSIYTLMFYMIMLAVTRYTYPNDLHPDQPTLNHVWYYGWITAVSTGLGAVPLIFADDLGDQMLGLSNAVACGMMLSASYSLICEGTQLQSYPDFIIPSSIQRVLAGVILGLLFIYPTKKFLDQYENIHIGAMVGADAKKALLIVLVMFLHSFSEGIGIGVSFGGSTGTQLGFLISATLAVHNVPEGLAVALAVQPSGVSKLDIGLWCILTSIPQPIMAVLAFIFVEEFLPFLPIGLGFAGGAMFWVACSELLPDAIEMTSRMTACITVCSSFAVMLYVHNQFNE